jgi:acetylornithine deacetylase/succinyl-diaminopimelate desuccinylase-like protein
MEKILAYLKDHEAEFVAQLADYVRFPSVSAQKKKHGADMKACGEWLLAQYRVLGLEAKLYPTAPEGAQALRGLWPLRRAAAGAV